MKTCPACSRKASIRCTTCSGCGAAFPTGGAKPRSAAQLANDSSQQSLAPAPSRPRLTWLPEVPSRPRPPVPFKRGPWRRLLVPIGATNVTNVGTPKKPHKAPMKTCPACSRKAFSKCKTCSGCGAAFPTGGAKPRSAAQLANSEKQGQRFKREHEARKKKAAEENPEETKAGPEPPVPEPVPEQASSDDEFSGLMHSQLREAMQRRGIPRSSYDTPEDLLRKLRAHKTGVASPPRPEESEPEVDEPEGAMSRRTVVGPW